MSNIKWKMENALFLANVAESNIKREEVIAWEFFSYNTLDPPRDLISSQSETLSA
jgi:hypothetical protein